MSRRACARWQSGILVGQRAPVFQCQVASDLGLTGLKHGLPGSAFGHFKDADLFNKRCFSPVVRDSGEECSLVLSPTVHMERSGSDQRLAHCVIADFIVEIFA